MKKDKAEVNYGRGHKDAHCGPVEEWEGGDCQHFLRRSIGSNGPTCELVKGIINPRGWCELWKRK